MSIRSKRLWLLVQKNYRIKRNQGIFNLLTLLLFPIVIIGIVAIFRLVAKPELNGNCHTQGYALPSAGTLPWLQTLVCGVNPSCSTTTRQLEEDGSVNTGIKVSTNGNLILPCDADTTIDLASVKGTQSGFLSAFTGNKITGTVQSLTKVIADNALPIFLNTADKDKSCDNIANAMENTFSTLWDLIKPVWKGKIVYFPDTSSEVNDIISAI